MRQYVHQYDPILVRVRDWYNRMTPEHAAILRVSDLYRRVQSAMRLRVREFENAGKVALMEEEPDYLVLWREILRSRTVMSV